MSLTIQTKTREEVQRSLAAYLPGGPLWESAMVPGTNLNAVMAGLSGILLDVEVFNEVYSSEFIPSSQGTSFLEEWEDAVSIPDDCFPGQLEPDRTVRRLHVIVKLALLGAQTADDFERIALILGSVVEVSSLAENILPPYSVPFTPADLQESPFIIVVEGDDIATAVPPYSVPFDLSSSESILECLFKKIKPVNCNVLFRNTN